MSKSPLSIQDRRLRNLVQSEFAVLEVSDTLIDRYTLVFGLDQIASNGVMDDNEILALATSLTNHKFDAVKECILSIARSI